MQNVSVTLVVYTLIWMTLDKFLALVRPLKQQRLTIKASKYLILLNNEYQQIREQSNRIIVAFLNATRLP